MTLWKPSFFTLTSVWPWYICWCFDWAPVLCGAFIEHAVIFVLCLWISLGIVYTCKCAFKYMSLPHYHICHYHLNDYSIPVSIQRRRNVIAFFLNRNFVKKEIFFFFGSFAWFFWSFSSILDIFLLCIMTWLFTI